MWLHLHIFMFKKKANSWGHGGKGGHAGRGRQSRRTGYRRDAGLERGECSQSGCMGKQCQYSYLVYK